MVGYVDHMIPEVRYDPRIRADFVIVSVHALAHAFFTGIDKFLVDLFSDSAKAKVAEERFKWMNHTLPYTDIRLEGNTKL